MKYGFFCLLCVGALVLAEPALALTISPVRLEVGSDPGQTLTGEIQLFNEEVEAKTFYSSAANFESRGESGAPYFLPNVDEDLASWIEIQEAVTLEPNERIAVPFLINVPGDAKPGGHFAAIFWGTSAPETSGGGQVSVGGKLGMLILLSVTGDLGISDGPALELSLKDGARWTDSLPVSFVYRFVNSGRERIKPAGELTIKNFFGQNVSTLNANRRDGNVLPGSARQFELFWIEHNQDPLQIVESGILDSRSGFWAAISRQWSDWAIGPYSANLNLNYDRDNKLINAEVKFWIFPWQILSLVFGSLILFFGLGRWGLRRYNRWIIARASAGRLNE